MSLRILALLPLLALLAACSRGSELVGTWRTKDGSDTATMVLLKDRTGHFISQEQNLSAPIKKWWVDGEAFRYINVKGAEQANKIVAVEANVLTMEEPLGSGHISVWQRVH